MLWLLSRLCLPPAPAPSPSSQCWGRGALMGPRSNCSQVDLISDSSEPAPKELLSDLITARFDGSGSTACEVLCVCGAQVSLSCEFVGLLGTLGFLQHPGIPGSLLRISVMGRCKQSLSNQRILWPLGPFFFLSLIFGAVFWLVSAPSKRRVLVFHCFPLPEFSEILQS